MFRNFLSHQLYKSAVLPTNLVTEGPQESLEKDEFKTRRYLYQLFTFDKDLE